MRINEALITVAQVADATGFSVRSVWRLIAEGRTPAPVRIGRTIRFRVADIERWIQAKCPPRDEFENQPASSPEAVGA